MPINNTITYQEFLDHVSQDDLLTNNLSDKKYTSSVLICASSIGKNFWLNILLSSKTNVNKNSQSFDSLPILTWHAWLQDIWQSLAKADPINSPLALNTLQQNYVLTKLLNQFVERRNKDKYGQFFNPLHLSQSNINAIGRGVINSWKFIQQHDLTITPKDIVSADHFLFYHVVKNYNNLLEKNNWLDPDKLSDALSQRLKLDSANKNALPKTIYLSGFTQLTKQQTRCKDTLKLCGCQFITIEDNNSGKKPLQTFTLEKFDSSLDEVGAIIKQVKSNTYNNKPVAIFVANLLSKENLIRGALTESFGDNEHLCKSSNQIDWHIESKKPLIDMPALNILQSLFNCWQPSFDYVDFSKLLLSPYFWQTGDLSDMEFRHLLDKKLRQELPTKVTFKQVLSQLKKTTHRLLANTTNDNTHIDKPFIAHVIIKSCEGFISEAHASSMRFDSFHQSGAWLSEQLGLFQWIGYSDFSKIIKPNVIQSETELPSHYSYFYRAIINASGSLHYLHDCLDTISSLNLVFQDITVHEKPDRTIPLSEFRRIFFQQLQVMSAATNPQSAQATVQIFDLEVSDSLYFDNACLMNLNDKDWPPSKQFYPFIPFNILANSETVSIDSQRIFAHAQFLTSRLLSISQKCTISYSQFIDGLEVSHSNVIFPFIKTITALGNNSENGQQSNKQNIYDNTSVWQSYTSNKTTPLIKDKSEIVVIPAGTDAIKNQIACPFRAWAKNKADILPLDDNELALNSKLHGISIHKILELFWSKYKDHDTLVTLYQNETIDSAIKSIVDSYFAHIYKDSFYDNFSRVYPPALLNLVREWLNFEYTRPRFTIVEQEKKQRFVINNAAFNIKPDRIDKLLDDDSFLIIDYKSGNTDIKKWYDHFISEPQLPIYFLMYHQRIHSKEERAYGIAYASLKTKTISMTGILPDSDYAGFLTNVSEGKIKGFENMDSLINFWQETIGQACDNFINGQHKVNPTKDACKYCQYTSLCRINNLNNVANENDDNDDDFGDFN